MQLETERLLLSPTTIEDAAFIKILVNTPRWIKNIGDRKVYTMDDALTYVQIAIDAYDPTKGIGQFIMRQKGGNKLVVGVTGIYKRPGLEHADIGFALMPEFSGLGYAFEGTKAIMDHVLQTTDIKRIEGITIEENVPSRKLLEKLGLSFEKIIKLPKDDVPLMLYAINL